MSSLQDPPRVKTPQRVAKVHLSGLKLLPSRLKTTLATRYGNLFLGGLLRLVQDVSANVSCLETQMAIAARNFSLTHFEPLLDKIGLPDNQSKTEEERRRLF